jgi:hypothetical protein
VARIVNLPQTSLVEALRSVNIRTQVEQTIIDTGPPESENHRSIGVSSYPENGRSRKSWSPWPTRRCKAKGGKNLVCES